MFQGKVGTDGYVLRKISQQLPDAYEVSIESSYVNFW
jgi:hypothetical protein